MKQTLSTLQNSSFGRYVVTVSGALLLDLLITFVLRQWGGFSLTVSAAFAFILVGILAYFVFEYWTFQRPESAFSPGRLLRSFGVLCLGFAGRVGTIGLLEWLYSPSGLLDLIVYGAGVGVSFTINYLANRFWVFNGPDTGPDS